MLRFVDRGGLLWGGRQRQPCLGKLEADAQRSRSCLPSRLYVPMCLCPGRELFKACKDVGRDRL